MKILGDTVDTFSAVSSLFQHLPSLLPQLIRNAANDAVTFLSCNYQRVYEIFIEADGFINLSFGIGVVTLIAEIAYSKFCRIGRNDKTQSLLQMLFTVRQGLTNLFILQCSISSIVDICWIRGQLLSMALFFNDYQQKVGEKDRKFINLFSVFSYLTAGAITTALILDLLQYSNEEEDPMSPDGGVDNEVPVLSEVELILEEHTDASEPIVEATQIHALIPFNYIRGSSYSVAQTPFRIHVSDDRPPTETFHRSLLAVRIFQVLSRLLIHVPHEHSPTLLSSFIVGLLSILLDAATIKEMSSYDWMLYRAVPETTVLADVLFHDIGSLDFFFCIHPEKLYMKPNRHWRSWWWPVHRPGPHCSLCSAAIQPTTDAESAAVAGIVGENDFLAVSLVQQPPFFHRSCLKEHLDKCIAEFLYDFTISHSNGRLESTDRLDRSVKVQAMKEFPKSCYRPYFCFIDKQQRLCDVGILIHIVKKKKRDGEMRESYERIGGIEVSS